MANRQENIINNIDEGIAKLGDLTNQLRDAWEGASGAQAYNALEQISSVIKRIVDGVGECTEKLVGVAEAFESIDNGENGIAIRKPSLGFIPMPIRPNFVLSMPGMVRIDPDRVRDIAKQCKDISVSISENTDAFFDCIEELSNDWEGRSYVKYEEDAREVIKALRETEDAMEEFISRIMNAANRYEEIDNSL